MKMDPQLGGTEKDGQKSTKYCSYCYQKGKFTQVDISVQEMQAQCIKYMQEKGTPHIFAWLLTRGLPRLERWQHSK